MPVNRPTSADVVIVDDVDEPTINTAQWAAWDSAELANILSPTIPTSRTSATPSPARENTIRPYIPTRGFDPFSYYTSKKTKTDDTYFLEWACDKYPAINLGLDVATLFAKKGYQKTAEQGIVGIEVEQESHTALELPELDGWSVHNEGSLRGFGFEYVLSPPLPTEKALSYTEILFKQLAQEPNYKPTSSIRTSIHAHFDVTKYSFNQLLTFTGVYWMLEEFLSDFAGETRKGNLFCIRLKDSLYFSKVLSEVLSKPGKLKVMLCSEHMRYSSLNFASLSKFGSLEFRLMRGTANVEEVKLWVNALECIRLYALKFNNLKEFVETFYRNIPAEDVLSLIFPPDILKKLLAYNKTKDYVTGIRSVVCELKGVCSSVPSFDFEVQTESLLKESKEEYNALIEKRKKKEEESLRLVREGYIALVNLGIAPESDLSIEEDNTVPPVLSTFSSFEPV